MSTMTEALDARLEQRVAELVAQGPKIKCELTAYGLEWIEREFGTEEEA